MAKYVMALDSGTTSNRCILFDENGKIRSVAQKEFIQHFPKPGWVEHDAGEIWSTQLSVAREAMNQIEATAEDIAAIGITNQRETTIVWDKNTGQPVYHAIVWQCRRTSEYCDSLKKEGLENPALEVRHICSLLQMIAGITVNNGHQFTPGQFLAMGQQRGLDAASKSAITGFITKEDDIGTVESPFGKVQLVQLIGVKAEEIEQMKNKTMTPAQLAEILKDGLTDYKR